MGKIYAVLVLVLLMLGLAGCADSRSLTLSDIERSFASVGDPYTEQAVPTHSKPYNQVAPAAVLMMDNDFGDRPLKVYIYPSSEAMEKGLREFQGELSKDLTYGLKDSVFQAKNVLFISKYFTDADLRAIKKLR